MPKIRVFRGRRIKDNDGDASRFYSDIAGNVYDDGMGYEQRDAKKFQPTLKVGKITADGNIRVKARYAAKYGKRLEAIKQQEKKDDE